MNVILCMKIVILNVFVSINYILGKKPSEVKYILSGIQIIILSKKGQVVHFLQKRKCWMLYFNSHVTYDLPKTPKLLMSSKLHYGISKPKFRAKQHISRIAGTVLIAAYFFGGYF